VVWRGEECKVRWLEHGSMVWWVCWRFTSVLSSDLLIKQAQIPVTVAARIMTTVVLSLELDMS
jgi:hypothetical protein